MDEFLGVLPKFLGSDIMEKEQSNGRASRIKDDEKSIAKMEFKSALFRVKETKEELEQLHRISEEEVSLTLASFLLNHMIARSNGVATCAVARVSRAMLMRWIHQGAGRSVMSVSVNLLTQNIQVWSSQCRSLCFQPKASPVQKSGLDGRRNGDRGGGDLAEQGERRQQRESREQRLDPLARPRQDEKCKRRVRVRLFQRHVQCHDHQVTLLNIFFCQHLQTKFVEIFPTSKESILSLSSHNLLGSSFNFVNRRLERDTSVDRLSTGSRESMQSTQSEWLPGEKKKSRVRPCKSLSRLYFYSVSQGLLGKLKNAVKKDRNISEEREFGSGSDISSASVQSKQSTSSKMSTASKLIQRARYTLMVCKFSKKSSKRTFLKGYFSI